MKMSFICAVTGFSVTVRVDRSMWSVRLLYPSSGREGVKGTSLRRTWAAFIWAASAVYSVRLV
jgi:hypothetical protein